MFDDTNTFTCYKEKRTTSVTGNNVFIELSHPHRAQLHTISRISLLELVSTSIIQGYLPMNLVLSRMTLLITVL